MAAVSIAGCTLLTLNCSTEPTNPRKTPLAPLSRVSVRERSTNNYFVLVVDTVPDVNATAHRLARAHGGKILHVYRRVLHGFAMTVPPNEVNGLRAEPAISELRQIEAGKFRFTDHTYQLNAPWGLDRIDQRTSTNSWYSYSETGSGVRIYIIDSGIRTAHTDFGGRASIGIDERPEDGKNGQDCLGHGTHVSGTAAGTTYGVAKSATLIAVKINVACLDSLETQDIVDGIDWVAVNHVSPAVANMSFGGPPDTTIDQAVSNLIASGVPAVISAGNNYGGDACSLSPASVPEAITVGATRSNDARAAFSNIGSCLDIFAPGRDILSDWYTSNTATHVDSGTSMAAPHVTGAVARFLQFRPTLTPSEVTSGILSRATHDVVVDPGTNSPNVLLYTRFVESSVSSPTITSCGTFTWSQTGSGIGSSFTYGWQRWVQTGFPPYGGFWGGTVSGQSYTTNVCPGDNTFHLRATATNEFGMHGSVYVNGT